MAFEIIGMDDSVHTCDCCGKSNLKVTVVVIMNGERMNYGTTCASRHTKMKSSEIRKSIEDRYETLVSEARKELHNTVEVAALNAKKTEANKLGLIGRPFKDFIIKEWDAYNAKCVEIASRYSVRESSIF